MISVALHLTRELSLMLPVARELHALSVTLLLPTELLMLYVT